MKSSYNDIIRDRFIRPARNLVMLPRRLALQDSKRIFAIGLSKTGTSSLARAMGLLGYATCHFPVGMLELRGGQLWLNRKYAAAFECLLDTPVARFYRELDESYPGARFVLTVRDVDSWLNSCEKHFARPSWGRKIDRLNMDLYGSASFDRDLYAAAYERHVDDVLDYFKDRQKDLLVMDVAKGDGWEKLCPYLGVSVPDAEFPWANRTRI